MKRKVPESKKRKVPKSEEKSSQKWREKFSKVKRKVPENWMVEAQNATGGKKRSVMSEVIKREMKTLKMI